MTDDEYPDQAILDRIADWPFSEKGWLKFCAEAWNDNYGRVKWPHCVDDKTVRFITGGWSGNESIIDAMKENEIMWDQYWESSERGGLHVFGDDS